MQKWRVVIVNDIKNSLKTTVYVLFAVDIDESLFIKEI